MIDKKSRFKKVASYRTNQILKYLKLLGNCSNKNNYDFSNADVSKIFSVIDKETKLAKTKFSDKKIKKFEL